MDPITATIVAGVLWFFLGSLLSGVIYFTATLLGFAFGAADNPGITAAFIFGGWLLAVGWQIFVIIQVIIHIVTLIQLIGSA